SQRRLVRPSFPTRRSSDLENVPVAIEKFKEALTNGILSEKRLEHSVKKILRYKYKAELYDYKPIDTLHLVQELNRAEDEALHYKDRKSTRLNSSHVKISYA